MLAVALGLALIAVCGACGDKAPSGPPSDGNGDGNGDGDGMPMMNVAVELVADGLVHPLGIAEVPDGTGRLFVIDQVGLVHVIEDGRLQPEPALDVRDRMVELMPSYDERGLLGLAFHPRFSENGRLFLHYSAPPRVDGYDNTTVIAEYELAPADTAAEPAFVAELLAIDQPQFNHAGGTIAFGPDDHLYVAIGDGGGRADEGMGHVDDWYEGNAGGNGQDIEQNLLGSVLRLDVSTPGMYTIPADNPFVGTSARGEIYAYGLRNPYRFSFDAGGSRSLILGDAGQNLWEEINVIEAGGNYGWNVKEGRHCFDAENPLQIPDACPDVDPVTGERLRDPVIELYNLANPMRGQDLGLLVVVAGHVYRGASVPALEGRYVFGAFSTESTDDGPAGAVFAADPRGASSWPYQRIELRELEDEFVLAFGEDLSRELYVLTAEDAGPQGSTGRIYRLVQR